MFSPRTTKMRTIVGVAPSKSLRVDDTGPDRSLGRVDLPVPFVLLGVSNLLLISP